MKKTTFRQVCTSVYIGILCNLLGLISFGQDSAASSSTTTHTVTTTAPATVPAWAWVVGAVVLLIIIIALASKKKDNGHKDNVTYTRTTKTENNP